MLPTRRTALLTAAAAALAAGVPAYAGARTADGPSAGSAGASGTGRVRLRLPAPSGERPVGTVSLRLVDRTRRDPWLPDRAHRELMVDVRYPARSVRGFRRAPQMTPGAAAGFAELNNFADVPADRVDWAATLTHAHEGAPVDAASGPLPVVLYSPGVLDPRTYGTTTADDLASRGFLVVRVDHTYDAGAVEFPGRRVERSRLPEAFEKTGGDEEKVRALLRKTLAARVADLRFVLDALASALPAQVRAVADLSRVGAYGQSAGGFAALQAMHDDRRLRAAGDLDGVLAHVQDEKQPGHYASVARDGLDRPFLLFGKDGNRPDTVPSWGALVHNSRTEYRTRELAGAQHGSFTDSVVLLPQIVRALGLPREVLTSQVGTVGQAEAVRAQRSALARLFSTSLSSG